MRKLVKPHLYNINWHNMYATIIDIVAQSNPIRKLTKLAENTS